MPAPPRWPDSTCCATGPTSGARSALTGQHAAVDELQTGDENLCMMARLAGLSGAARLGARPSCSSGSNSNQPITPVVQIVRGLLLDLPVGGHPWQALAWCSGILLASVALSAYLFRRRIA